MYLARQPHGNGLSESRSAVADDDDDDVVENERRLETIGSQQFQPQPQSQQLQPQPQSQSRSQQQLQTSSTNTRNRETDPMRQHPSAWKLRDDHDDDDDDENEEEKEQPGDNFSATMERRAPPRVVVIGWDSFRTRLLLFLIACLLVWACVFFPLLGGI